MFCMFYQIWCTKKGTYLHFFAVIIIVALIDRIALTLPPLSSLSTTGQNRKPLHNWLHTEGEPHIKAS